MSAPIPKPLRDASAPLCVETSQVVDHHMPFSFHPLKPPAQMPSGALHLPLRDNDNVQFFLGRDHRRATSRCSSCRAVLDGQPNESQFSRLPLVISGAFGGWTSECFDVFCSALRLPCVHIGVFHESDKSDNLLPLEFSAGVCNWSCQPLLLRSPRATNVHAPRGKPRPQWISDTV